MSYLSVSINRNPFFKNHISVHSDEDTPKLLRPFKCAYEELRCIDGIDDFANLCSQLFKGLGQPIATVGVAAPLAPFVAMGALGAIADAKEQMTKIYPDAVLEIAKHEHALFEQLHREGRSPDEIAQIRDDLNKALDFLYASGSDKLRYQIDEFRRASAHRSTAALDRNASIFGAVGMSAMAEGMIPLIGHAVTEIIKNSVSTSTASGMSAAHSASIVSAFMSWAASGSFLIGQAAMAAKGITDAGSGLEKIEELSEQAASTEKLASNPQYSSPALDSANKASQELIAEKRRCTKHHSVSAGSTIAVGQTLMGVGTGLGMSVAGAPVAPFFIAPGAVATMFGAIQQVYFRKVEGRTLGADASESAQTQPMDLKPVIEHQGLGEAIDVAANRVVQEQDDVARSKLQSLIHHVLQDEMKSGKTQTEFSRMMAVEALAADAKKSSLKGTTLLKGDIAKLKPMLREYYSNGFFAGDAMDVMHLLNKLAAERFSEKRLVLTDSDGSDVLKKTTRDVVNNKSIDFVQKGALSLNRKQRKKTVNARDMFDAASRSDSINDILVRQLTKTLVKRTKTDSKHLRHRAVNALSSVATTANGKTR